MKIEYKCNICGSITSGQYRENPNYGSHNVVKCKCGNKGNSGYSFRYNIEGFEKVKR
jgi:hypothetical protein